MQGVGPDRIVLPLPAQEDREEVEAVLGRVSGQPFPHDGRTGGHEIGEADGLIGPARRFDPPRPAGEEGNPVPPPPIGPA